MESQKKADEKNADLCAQHEALPEEKMFFGFQQTTLTLNKER